MHRLGRSWRVSTDIRDSRRTRAQLRCHRGMDGPVNARTQPLVIATDVATRDVVARLSAASGTTPEVVSHPNEARAAWRGAPCVVLDAHAAAHVRSLGLPRRPGVVLVADSEPPPELWKNAVQIGVEQVIVLPRDQEALTAVMADTVESVGPS